MYLGDNIQFLRKQKGLKQEDLASTLGYKSATTITKWETGVAEPTMKTVGKLSDFFGVSVNDLYYKKLSLTPVASNKRAITINVLGRIAAGIPIDAVEEIIDIEEITEEMAATGTYFGLQIKGDSMEPRICSGDVVIVRQQDDAENGDIVIVLVNGDDATCKRLRKYRDGIELISNNPAYAPMFFSNEDIEKKPVKIIGKVVELRGKF